MVLRTTWSKNCKEFRIEQHASFFIKEILMLTYFWMNFVCFLLNKELSTKSYASYTVFIMTCLYRFTCRYRFSGIGNLISTIWEIPGNEMDCQNYQQYLWKTMLLGIRCRIRELTTMSTIKDIPILNALSVKKASFTTSTSTSYFDKSSFHESVLLAATFSKHSIIVSISKNFHFRLIGYVRTLEHCIQKESYNPPRN